MAIAVRSGRFEDRRGWPVLAGAGAAVIAGVLVRVLGILGEPLWLDEAYSAYAAAHDLRFLWQVVPAYETHPPFYYTLLHFWTAVFGDSLASLRAPGLICGLATIAVAALAGRAAGRLLALDPRRTVALACAVTALVALAPWLVAMSRDVRPYPVLILVYGCGLIALLRLAAQAEAGRLDRAVLAGFFVAQALAMWLHTLGPLYGAAMTLALGAVVIGRPLPRRDWLLILAGHLLVALVYLPALLIAIDQAPTWISSTWLRFRLHGIGWRLQALYLAPFAQAGLGAALLLALAAARLWRAPNGRRLALALVSLGMLPVAAAIGLSIAVAPVFIPRTMTACLLPVLLLLAIGGAAAPGRLWIAGLGGLLLLLATMIGTDVLARRAGPMQNWYPTVRWLDARFRPGDIVLSYPNEGDLPFRYAVRDLRLGLPSRPIPTAVPSLEGGWHPTGSRGVISLPGARLRAIARSPEVARVPTVWLLRLGPWAYDKGDVFLHELERAGRRPVARWRSGPIDIIGLRRCGPAEPCPAGPRGPAPR